MELPSLGLLAISHETITRARREAGSSNFAGRRTLILDRLTREAGTSMARANLSPLDLGLYHC